MVLVNHFKATQPPPSPPINPPSFICVFPLSLSLSLSLPLQWKREIDSKVQLPNGKNIPVVLLANKCDLPDPAVDKSQLDAFCKEHGFVAWFETSAKENKNIEEAVKGLVANILSHPDALQSQKEAKVESEAAKSSGSTLSLDDKAEKPKSGGCC
jgi:GTPase SAR1 family protein